MKPKRVLFSFLGLAVFGWLAFVSTSVLRSFGVLSDSSAPVDASRVADIKPRALTTTDTESNPEASALGESGGVVEDSEISRVVRSVASSSLDVGRATYSDLAGESLDGCQQHWDGMNELRCLRLRADQSPAPESDQGDRQMQVVLFDSAHGNDGSFDATLRQFVRRWGYATRTLEDVIEPGSLDEADVFVSYVPHLRVRDPSSPSEWLTVPAFTPDEVANIKTWVERGGSLLLVIDQMPFAGAAAPLAAAFSIEVSNGYVVDKQAVPYISSRAVVTSAITFSHEEGTLADTVVTRGASDTERVELIGAYSGAAFRLPPRAVSLLTFGDNFVSLIPERGYELGEYTPSKSVAGWSMGALLAVGEGRLAVFGEDSIPLRVFLWTAPDLVVDNVQLTKNVLRWLTER